MFWHQDFNFTIELVPCLSLLIFKKREMINVAREYITKHILKVFDWGWSNIDPAYFPCHLKIKLPKNRFREVLATHYPNPTQIF
jgi:hypothetical protein